MYVCNRFTIEVYKFTHSLHTFWHVPLIMNAIAMEVEDSEDRNHGRLENESRDTEDG